MGAKWKVSLILYLQLNVYRQLKRIWALAILTALKEGEIKFEQLGAYRNHFK